MLSRWLTNMSAAKEVDRRRSKRSRPTSKFAELGLDAGVVRERPGPAAEVLPKRKRSRPRMVP